MPILVHQFTIDRNGIKHTPTGWRDDSSGTITKGTDRDFDLDQVAEMGRRLWLKHLRQEATVLGHFVQLFGRKENPRGGDVLVKVRHR